MANGEENSFCCFARERRPQQANTLKTALHFGGILYKKAGKNTGFQIGVRIGENMHSSLFRGIFVINTGVKRSRHDHDGGLLGYCLEQQHLGKGHIDQRLEQTRKIPEKHQVLIIFTPQAVVLRVPHL